MSEDRVSLTSREKRKFWMNLGVFHVVILAWSYGMGWIGYGDSGNAWQVGLWLAGFSLVLVGRAVYLNAPEYMSYGYYATYAWGGLLIAAAITLIGALVFRYRPYIAPSPLAAALWTAVPAALGGWLWAENWPFQEAKDPRAQF